MIRNVIAKLDREVCGERIKELAGKIVSIDRLSNFSKFHETAVTCRDEMKAIGLSSPRIWSFPADGKTSIGDYVIPRAWDPEAAELRVVTPDGDRRTLASYREIPCSLFLYSASTPAGGIEAEVVAIRGNREADYKGVNVRGKIVFTSVFPAEVWRLARRHGAIGIVTDSSEVHPPHEGVHWANYCFVPDNASRMFGFSLSKEEGKYLRDLIARAKRSKRRVKLHATVKARSYAGTIDTVSGVLPGKNPKEEVLVFAHLNEVGAWDNAAGAAAVLEVARVLTRLIAQGKLPQPERSIRFMHGWECYSLMIYLLKQKKKSTAAIAGLVLDAFGVDPLKYESPLKLFKTADANPSYVDMLLEAIGDFYLRDKAKVRLWASGRFLGGDSLPSDPCFNVPMPYLYQPCHTIWHTSADTVDRLESDVLKWVAVIGATHLYYIASAGYKEAMELADEICLRQPMQLSNLTAGLSGRDLEEKTMYVREIETARLRSTARLVPSKLRKRFREHLSRLEKRIALSDEVSSAHTRARRKLTALERRASSIVPRRLVPGLLTLETLPEDAKEECRWGPDYQVLGPPILWSDGERDVLEISRRMAQETGAPVDLKDLIECFEFLAEYGFVEISRRGEHQ